MRDVTVFSIGDILKLSFSVYFNNLQSFLPLSLIALAPLSVFSFLGGSSFTGLSVGDVAASNSGSFYFWYFWRLAVPYDYVGMLCQIWLQAGLAYGVVRYLRGGNPGFLETFVQSLRRLPAAIFVGGAVAFATFFGFLLLIVPGIIITLVLWVALPAMVVEVEHGGLRALRRSAQLTAGYKGEIFGLALILLLVEVVMLVVSVNVVATNSVLADIVVESCFIVWYGIWATAVAITYHDLRILKDGVDTGEISRVFE